MEKKVCDILSEMGYAITTQPVFPKDLFSFDTVLMTNALIGAVPVLSLDGKGFSPPATLWRDISLRVL